MTRARAALLCVSVSLLLVPACAQDNNTMNELAERYVRLVLAVGQHDADYVDAYYGPAEWRTEAEAQKLPLAEIASRASALAQAIAAGDGRRADTAAIPVSRPAARRGPQSRLDADGNEAAFR